MPKAARLLWHGLAPTTRTTYDAAWRTYERFAIDNGYSPLPVTFNSLSHWATEILEKNKAETVKAYITALRSRHVDLGISTIVFDDLRIKRILNGSLRLHGSRPVRERAEITKPILL